MGVFRAGTHSIWAGFAALWVVGWIGLDGYWLVTESGLVGSLAEWQARHFGGWYPKVTVLVLLAAQIAILVLIKLAIEKLTGRRMTAPVEEPPPSP